MQGYARPRQLGPRAAVGAVDLTGAPRHPPAAMALPQPNIGIHKIGLEAQPLVVIDNYSGMVEELREAGSAAQYGSDASYYPGVRANAVPRYHDSRRGLMAEVVSKVFGFTRAKTSEPTFALATLPESDLVPLQRIPHFDKTGSRALATVHYLLGPESGGTAFFRHRRTGFKTVPPDREEAYFASLAEDEREYGPSPPRYHYGDSERFEQIAEVKAVPDRLIIYRSRQLHTGVIPDATALSSDPRQGRLTITMFITGA